MSYQYRPLHDQERDRIFVWLILNNLIKNAGSYTVTINEKLYRITHNQTYSGHEDPLIEEIISKNKLGKSE